MTPTDAIISRDARPAAHTPGPWFAQRALDGFEFDIRSRPDEYYVAALPDIPGQTEANARLIAAAPELLDALKGLTKAEFAEDLKPYWTAAHAAIAKAEGRES